MRWRCVAVLGLLATIAASRRATADHMPSAWRRSAGSVGPRAGFGAADHTVGPRRFGSGTAEAGRDADDDAGRSMPVAPSSAEPGNPALAPSTGPAVSPVATAASPVATATSGPDAYLNFGDGPFPGAGGLATGTAQPWYDSPVVANAFGGVPDVQQRADFASAVLADVEQSFRLGGLSPSLTLDPGAGAQHTLSIVSGAVGGGPNVIGDANVGGDGLAFIDRLTFANTPAQLAEAVAHTITHELLHTFGVAGHPDQTGRYLDSATLDPSLLTDPNATFSPAAAQVVLTGGEVGAAGPVMAATVVPEPGSVACWGLGVLLAAGTLGRSRRRSPVG